MKTSSLLSTLCLAWVTTQASLPETPDSRSADAESPHLPVWATRQTKHLRPVMEKRQQQVIPEPNEGGKGAVEDGK